ncbi:MAG: hypothetical protein IKD90_10225 [Clostridiales bacterium]|nr:hypothetical protein [Clostridiales bacterium]
MSENKEMNTYAESMYRCKAAKNLYVCGWVVMVVCIMVSLFLFLFVAEYSGRDGAECLKNLFCLLATFFGGYIIKCVLGGLAIIVESHYRKSIQG